MSLQEVSEPALEERPRLVALAAAVAHSALLAALILASELLHLILKNRHFAADLGVIGGASVVAAYLAFAVVTGGIVGAVLRSPRSQMLALALAYYVLASLKMFWLSAPLLGIPIVLAGFVVFSVLAFAALHLAVARFALPDSTPAWFVVAYFHGCHLIAAAWTTEGGDLVAYLTAPRTLVICALSVVGFVASVAAHTAIERRRSRVWGARFQTAFVIVLLAIGASQSRCSAAAAAPKTAAAPGAPDIYVVSFDALRRDAFKRYLETAPPRFAKRIADSTRFANVITEGATTYRILANNTFAGARRACADSLPGQLRSGGYTTMMLLGRFGARMVGSDCYDYYYSGDGSTLAQRFALPSVLRAVRSPGKTMRGAAIPSSLMVDRLAGELTRAGDDPVFAYLHVLDLHAPYVAPGQHEADADAMSDYMRTCYLSACDASVPANARLIELAKRTYEATLVQLDVVTAAVEQLARSRGRPFLLVLTADHGELFGEYGGFAHVGGFVPELLNVPFIVYDSRAARPGVRCELQKASEALRATALGSTYPNHDALAIAAPPLGTATIDRATRTVRYEIDERSRPHVGTWRNIHPQPVGSLPFAVADCN